MIGTLHSAIHMEIASLKSSAQVSRVTELYARQEPKLASSLNRKSGSLYTIR